MQQYKLTAAVAVTMALAWSLGLELASADGDQLETLPDLFEAARSLESVHLQITDHRKSYADKRYRLLALFAGKPKGTMCANYYSQMTKTLGEYKYKAHQYVADSKKQQGWFGNIMQIVGPVGPMRYLSKSDAVLREITARYEKQFKTGTLTDVDVDCDMLRMEVHVLDKILFVLQTDLKYLALEQPQVLNLAIFRQLEADKFLANHNFYTTVELSPKQSQLLRDFYLAQADPFRVTFGEAVEHFSQLTSLIIGRLHDSCLALENYHAAWARVEPERAKVCAGSTSDLKNDLFAGEHRLEDYQSSARFCDSFLNSLEADVAPLPSS